MVPAVVEALAVALAAMAVVMEAMVQLHTAPVVQDRERPQGSSEKARGNYTLAAEAAESTEVDLLLELAVQVVVAVGGQTLKQLLIPGRPIPAAEAAAELVIMIQPVVGSCKAELVARASCASACTRKRNNKLKGERLCTTL